MIFKEKIKSVKNKGFTMIEIIIVISIAGIIATAISVFMKTPVIAYSQTIKRAELADQAFLTVKKIKHDVRMALPNSIRTVTVGNKVYLELITVSNGGKYRSQDNETNTGDVLDFTTLDNSFDVLSNTMTFRGGEKIVVANIGSPGYDAYSLDNMSDYVGALNTSVDKIVISPKKFPLESSNESFYVVDKVMSYVCDKTNQTLTKYWGYPISSSQPTNNLEAPLLNASSSLVTSDLKDCAFVYNEGVNTRNAIVTIFIKLQNEAQEATLYNDTYVRNF